MYMAFTNNNSNIENSGYIVIIYFSTLQAVRMYFLDRRNLFLYSHEQWCKYYESYSLRSEAKLIVHFTA